MTVKFKFLSTDPYVIEKLEMREVFSVERWQEWTLDYRFSFHTLHEAGWPCYLLEEGRDGQQLPKVNLKDYTGEFLGGGLVQEQDVAEDFKGVIAENLERFRTLARKYYEGEEVKEKPPGWVIQFTCNKIRNNPPKVVVKLPTGTTSDDWEQVKDTAAKPKCPQHKNSACMVGAPVEMPHAQLILETQRYDTTTTPWTIRDGA
jgi:hypothetical protein